MSAARDDFDESSQQGPHEIRAQRVGDRLAAASDHISQQRQPERMAVRDLDELIVIRRADATHVQVLPALLGIQVAQRDHPHSQAGSDVQAGLGGERPATTVRAVAGRRGNNQLRTQSSTAANRS
jgi:hypothetical protein